MRGTQGDPYSVQEASLGRRLRELEGAPYPAYRDLRGRFAIGPGTLEVLHVQPDPYAPPSRLRITFPIPATGLDLNRASREFLTATEDFLARSIERWLMGHPAVDQVIRCDPAGQQVLRRTVLTLHPDRAEILLFADLPARGRRIEGQRAADALSEGLPRLLSETLLAGSYDTAALDRHRACHEDYLALREMLAVRGWIAFIADGSRLARRSGEEDTPMMDGNVPFAAPPELAAEVRLPHAGLVRGTAISRGITLLCGGGFHGKSTLLRALAKGVYPHIPEDGRERIATTPSAMGIRAEDGRAVTDIDLRPFLHDLPNQADPARFTTGNASGATSQAAAVIEALSIGCRCLLIDEDTSATNFLLRDPWMARLLRPEQEPIVPLLTRLREIHDRLGVSAVIVVGGSGEAFRVADRALVMDAYRPMDATTRMVDIRRAMEPAVIPPAAEWPQGKRSLPIRRLRDGGIPRVRAPGAQRILVGESEVTLSAAGALVHPSQARTLATILTRWLEEGGGEIVLPDAAREAAQTIETAGPGAFASHPRGDLAEVRAQEIEMCASRLRYHGARDAAR